MQHMTVEAAMVVVIVIIVIIVSVHRGRVVMVAIVVVVVEVELVVTGKHIFKINQKSCDLLRVGSNNLRFFFFFQVVQAHPQQIGTCDQMNRVDSLHFMSLFFLFFHAFLHTN